MESRAPAPNQAGDRGRSRARWWMGLIKAALGVALLAALLVWGRIDLKALAALADAPSAVVIAIGLLLAQIPLAALRWGILLRAFGVAIPFGKLLHFVSIGLLAALFLFGPAGGDAVRGLYAWRAVGRGGGRVAASVLADRLFGLFALLSIALIFSLFNWHWMRQVPALAVLGTSLFLVFAAGMIGAGALFVAPRLTRPIEVALSRWPRAAELAMHLGSLILMLRTNPLRLGAAFGLALLLQIFCVVAVVVLAQAIKIGSLGVTDYMFAVPLTLVVNSLPITPNGLGVGEIAFDQICRWLEAVPSDAAYSSIFFAFRSVSIVVSLIGLVSFVIYRKAARLEPTQ